MAFRFSHRVRELLDPLKPDCSDRAARLLHLVHQRLLSLYPAVSETLVEEVRLLSAEAARLLEGDAGAEPLAAFVERALLFLEWMESEVVEG